MKFKVLFSILCIALSAGCSDVIPDMPGYSFIYLSVTDSAGNDLLDMNSEPHYTWRDVKPYYLKQGEKRLFDVKPGHVLNGRYASYSFDGMYNRHVMYLSLGSSDESGKSAVMIEWEAAEKPDTLVTLWKKSGYYQKWEQIWLNGKLLVSDGDKYERFVEIVRNR